MNTQTCIPISDARRRIFKISEDVQTPGVFYTLTEKGRPKAVLISAEEFESWQETIETLQDFPDIEKDIKKAEQEYKDKKYLSLDSFLEKEGFVRKTKK